MSQSIFEKSTAPQRSVSKKDLHRAALRAHHYPLRQPCVSLSCRLPPHFQTIWSKQKQRRKADAGGSCAFACEAKRARRQGHAGSGGGHGDVQEAATSNAGPAISWQGSVLLLHPGASLAQHVPARHSALAGALLRAAHEPAKGSIRTLRLQGANLRPNLAYINHLSSCSGCGGARQQEILPTFDCFCPQQSFPAGIRTKSPFPRSGNRFATPRTGDGGS